MDSPKQSFTSFCTPSQVYLGFSVLVFIVLTIMTKPSLKYIGIHILYIMFWTILLNFICYVGYVNVSWFLLLAPFILIGLMLFLVIIFKLKIKVPTQ